MIIELVYITKHYACGCATAKPVRPPRAFRDDYVDTPCKVCTELYDRARERRIEQAAHAAADRAARQLEQRMQAPKRYLVNGTPMSIKQDKMGVWRGKRQQQGKLIQKTFGMKDPRPLLEVAP